MCVSYFFLVFVAPSLSRTSAHMRIFVHVCSHLTLVFLHSPPFFPPYFSLTHSFTYFPFTSLFLSPPLSPSLPLSLSTSSLPSTLFLSLLSFLCRGPIRSLPSPQPPLPRKLPPHQPATQQPATQQPACAPLRRTFPSPLALCHTDGARFSAFLPRSS